MGDREEIKIKREHIAFNNGIVFPERLSDAFIKRFHEARDLSKDHTDSIEGQVDLGPKCNPLDQYIDDYVTKQKELRADWIEKFMEKTEKELPRCVNCKFFHDSIAPTHPESRIRGRCRRNAPTHAGFPLVWARDFCGEHERE